MIWARWRFHNGRNKTFKIFFCWIWNYLTPLSLKRSITRKKTQRVITVMALFWLRSILTVNSYCGAVCDTVKLRRCVRRLSLNFTFRRSRIGVKILWCASILGIRYRYISKQIYHAGAECWRTVGKTRSMYIEILRVRFSRYLTSFSRFCSRFVIPTEWSTFQRETAASPSSSLSGR